MKKLSIELTKLFNPAGVRPGDVLTVDGETVTVTEILDAAAGLCTVVYFGGRICQIAILQDDEDDEDLDEEVPHQLH